MRCEGKQQSWETAKNRDLSCSLLSLCRGDLFDTDLYANSDMDEPILSESGQLELCTE